MLNDDIVIVDYNMGNLRSVQKAFEKLGVDAVISNEHSVIFNASKIVLPGVGAFKDGMKNLESLGLKEVLNKAVIENKTPFLGVCLGMQLISTKGYEHGEAKGLGWVEAEVVKFQVPDQSEQIKVPHVGWNNVSYLNHNPMFEGIPNASDFYFVHSYHFMTNEDVVTSTTDYGLNFVSSVNKDNIYAFQFHPEKSQSVGLRLLKNFIDLDER